MKISYQGTLEVRGEAVIRLSVLEEYNKTASEPLKNARNAAAGAIRNLDPKITAERKPEIYFYDVNYLSTGERLSQVQAQEFLKAQGVTVKKGVFGADMKIELLNDGPFTIILDSDELKMGQN